MNKVLRQLSIVAFITFLFLCLVFFSIRYFTVKKAVSNESIAHASSTISSPVFPIDHASHNWARSEWWYLNLIVKSVTGTGSRDLGFVVSFSRVNGTSALLSSRYDDYNKSFAQATNTGGSLAGSLSSNLMHVRYANGSTVMTLQELSPGAYGSKRFTLKGYTPQAGTLDLVLKERTIGYTVTTTPLLWGCTGIISVFSPQDTAYYSMPNLDISGTIKDSSGLVRTVSAGKAWIDHQWFNSLPPSDWRGHYWLMNQSSSKANVFDTTTPHQSIGYVRQIYSSGSKYSYWVRKKANGSNDCGTTGTQSVLTYGLSGYPSSMRVQLTKTTQFASINYYGTSDNQIFVPPAGPAFVETVSRTSGTVDGIPSYGVGIMETHLKR